MKETTREYITSLVIIFGLLFFLVLAGIYGFAT